MEGDITHQMTIFVFHLGIIIFAAKLSGMLFEKLGMQGTVGEILAGIVIGPYMLGAVPLPFLGFPDGVFPSVSGSVPVTAELYGISTIASIILLFIAGLETDLKLLMRYIFSGGFIGSAGVFLGFFPAAMAGVIFLDKPLFSMECLFLGIMGVATSVGITAIILSKNKTMESPEGVTIMSGVLIGDVLCIISFAVIAAIPAVLEAGGDGLKLADVLKVAGKALGVWLGISTLGLVFSSKISSFLKRFRSKYVYAAISLGMALFLAGIFEKAGLAMIIGAYVMGLSLSNTDISFEIQEAFHSIREFFVPVFFTVMGMLVDIKSMTVGTVIFGTVYALAAMGGKAFACGGLAFFTGFNIKGAVRIGAGTMMRGEIVLIVAGVGLSQGFIGQNAYDAAIMMVLISIITAPYVIGKACRMQGRGTKKEVIEDEMDSYLIKMDDSEQADLLLRTIIRYFDNEGYFITRLILDYDVYQIRKGNIFIKLLKGSKKENAEKLNFIVKKDDMDFVKELVFEAMVKLEYNSAEILKKVNLKEMKKSSHQAGKLKIKINYDISKILDPECIITDLKSDTKAEIIRELVDVLAANKKISDADAIYKEVMLRESVISTGMQNGIAIPHARSEGLDHIQIAIGIKKEGVDFDSLDGKPSKIIVLIVSSTRKDDPHILVLSAISAYFYDIRHIEEFLSLTDRKEILDFFRVNPETKNIIRRFKRRFSV